MGTAKLNTISFASPLKPLPILTVVVTSFSLKKVALTLTLKKKSSINRTFQLLFTSRPVYKKECPFLIRQFFVERSLGRGVRFGALSSCRKRRRQQTHPNWKVSTQQCGEFGGEFWAPEI